MWMDKTEGIMADRLVRHSIRTRGIITTKSSLPDQLPPSPEDREALQIEHENEILYSQNQ